MSASAMRGRPQCRVELGGVSVNRLRFGAMRITGLASGDSRPTGLPAARSGSATRSRTGVNNRHRRWRRPEAVSYLSQKLSSLSGSWSRRKAV